MLGSKEDEMCREDMEDEYRELITLIDKSEMKIFEFGKHPLILSNAIEISKTIIEYVNSSKRCTSPPILRNKKS